MTRPATAGPARTVFFGSGAFGLPSLRRLVASPGVDLVAVVTAPARPSGRRALLTPTPIERWAADLGVAVLAPARLRAPETVDAVLALRPRLAVLADYGQIVPRPIFDLELGALNLHPSLLPRHRGATPIPAAILAGDPATGVTLFRMDAGLDTGPVVAAERVPLDGTETAPQLEERLAAVAAELLGRALGPWLRGEIEPKPQDDAAATFTRPLTRSDGRLDPNRPATELERRVRALQPWPGSYVEAGGRRIIVWRASVARARPGDAASRIAGHDDGLALVTVEGRLRLLEVQPAGGRRMTDVELRRGRPALVGAAV